MRPRSILGLAIALAVAACGESGGAAATTSATAAPTTTTEAGPATTTMAPDAPDGGDDGCADVVAVDVAGDASGYTFSVTVASTETGWDKYADAWVVRSRDGEVLGERVLAHPHVEEQPFTRSLSGVAVPEDVTEVVVAARDSVLGFCGSVLIVDLAER